MLFRSYGNPYTGADVYFRIIRSGHRNLNGASLGSIVSQNNPIVSQQLVINNNTNVLNAGAVRIKERWKGQDMFYTKDTLVQAITYAPLFTKTLYPYNDHFTKQYTNLLNPNNVLFQHLPNRGYFVSSHTKNETFPGNYSDHYTTIAKSWMKLDLSSIPQGSTIASAQLFLNSHQNISDGSGHQDDGIFHNSTNPHQIDANVFRGS